MHLREIDVLKKSISVLFAGALQQILSIIGVLIDCLLVSITTHGCHATAVEGTKRELQERAKEQSFGNIFFAPTRHLFWWQTKEGLADELDLKKSIL